MRDKLLEEAMTDVQNFPKMNIHGKWYTQVATRVEAFRRAFGSEYGIITEILEVPEPDLYRVRAMILSPENRLLATGLSEEYRGANRINQTSALEVAETSAIGRALAALGLSGGEYASYYEVQSAIETQNQMDSPYGPVKDDEPEEFVKVAHHEPKGNGHVPEVNQYEFFVPEGASPEDIDGIFQFINGLETDEQCVAYWNALAELRQWMVPEDIEEIKASIHGRRKQLRG